eukprot:7762378-Pyramimonas_sp.AAC.1
MPWSPEKKRGVGKVGRRSNGNCSRAEKSAGMWNVLGGLDKSRVSGGGAAKSGEKEPAGVRRSGGRTEESEGGSGNNLGHMRNANGT